MQGLNGSDIPSADRLSNLRRHLVQEMNADYPLPLPRSIVRQEGFPPRRVRSAKGDGWIRIENASEEDLAEFDPPERRSSTAATFRRRQAA